VKIKTSRFGELTVDDARIITFTEGIPGFVRYTKFVLLENEKNTPFSWLQSVENEELAFVLIDPLTVVPDYRVEISTGDIENLMLTSTDKAVVLCIVNIATGGRSVTVNLLGPIVFNYEKMLARQMVLADSTYSIKHDLLASTASAPSAAAK